MTYFVSPVLGMSLPVAGTGQAFEITVQNANMALIEGGFTSDRTTLGTHTTQIAALNTGAGRSTSTDFFPADLTALAAITGSSSPPCANGDSALVAEGGALFSRLAGAWVQQTPAVFALAATRDTAYAKASAAYRVAGAQCIISTAALVLMEYNGVGWQKHGLVKPSAAAATAGTATINDDGSVTFVSTGSGNVILTNCFMPTALYDTDNFDIEISYLGASAVLTARLCTAGVPDTSGANHDYSGTTYTQAGVVSPTTSLNAVSWPLNAGIGGIAHEATIELRHAGVAAVTRGFVSSREVTTLGTAETGMRGDLGHRLSTIFDGIQLLITGAGTMTIKVKPRA